MALISVALIILTVNFLGYRALRHQGHLGSEFAALIFQVSSFTLTALAMSIPCMLGRTSWVEWLSVIALHGIYSMTFLEFWSVTQGSFFLSVLDNIDYAQKEGLNRDSLESIGRRKRSERIAALDKGGLLKMNSGKIGLTRHGRRIGAVFEFLRSIMGIKNAG